MVETKLGAIVFAALLVGSMVGGGVAFVAMNDGQVPTTDPGGGPSDAEPDPGDQSAGTDSERRAAVETFDGPDDFAAYVRDGQSRSSVYLAAGGVSRAGAPAGDGDAGAAVEVSTDAAGGDTAVQRHSSTNVQVAGIDEPDVLKTTGETLYYAVDSPRVWLGEPTVDGEDEIRKRPAGLTHVFDTTDPADPQRIAGINASGDLLRTDDRLVVFQGDRLTAYDVSDPASPTEAWSRPINGSVETARLADGTIYLVTRSNVDYGEPCPIQPLGGDGPVVQCTDVYHPRRQIAVDATYSAFSIEPSDGAVEDTVSFVGSASGSTVYMSESGLYVTYTQRSGQGELYIDALLSEQAEIPDWVADRLREIDSYDLSAQSTRTEVIAAVQQWLGSLSTEERETVSERLSEQLTEYVCEHRRELVRTGVVRVGLGSGLSVEAVGEVPGTVNDQFSIDEYNGTLRIATTIPRQFDAESVNDLYTLEADSLERTGAVTGMGLDERIYAVRYVGETAYVVTFRQVDPFHVVDLSDPANPEEVGTLKLPGYSSYLHPVDESHVLGIGEEDGQVKAVLFDVSDPGDPVIDDTYYPDTGWSEIARSHHAFLMDRRHGVFFLPGGDGGYVVDYTDGDLDLETRVDTEGMATRAAYIDDYLYVVSDRGLVVVDETDWSRVTERRFE